jgi:hypothetical protein
MPAGYKRRRFRRALLANPRPRLLDAGFFIGKGDKEMEEIMRMEE